MASIRIATSEAAVGWLIWFGIGAVVAGTVGLGTGMAPLMLVLLWAGSMRYLDACFDGARAGLYEPQVQWREVPESLWDVFSPGLVLVGLVLASVMPAVLVFDALGGDVHRLTWGPYVVALAVAWLGAVPVPVLCTLMEDRRHLLAALDLPTAARVIRAAGWRYASVWSIYVFAGSAPAALVQLTVAELDETAGMVAAGLGIVITTMAGAVGLGATGAAMGRLVRTDPAVARAFDGPEMPR